MKLERLLELAGQDGTQLNELGGIDVKHNKNNIQSLKAKLKKANVDVSNMTNEMVLKFANKMDEITIESLKSKGMLKESVIGLAGMQHNNLLKEGLSIYIELPGSSSTANEFYEYAEDEGATNVQIIDYDYDDNSGRGTFTLEMEVEDKNHAKKVKSALRKEINS